MDSSPHPSAQATGLDGPRSAGQGFTVRLARWISRIFHPLVVVIPTLLLAITLDTGSLRAAVVWTAVSVGLVVVPVAIFILVNVRITGYYADGDVSIREHRYGLYLMGGACLVLLLVVLSLGGAPRIILGCIYAAVLSNVIGALVNRFSKVSVHAAAMAGCAAVLFYVSPLIGIAVGVATVVVGWARVYLNRHTWSQVLTGWSIAVACVAAVVTLYL